MTWRSTAAQHLRAAFLLSTLLPLGHRGSQEVPLKLEEKGMLDISIPPSLCRSMAQRLLYASWRDRRANMGNAVARGRTDHTK